MEYSAFVIVPCINIGELFINSNSKNYMVREKGKKYSKMRNTFDIVMFYFAIFSALIFVMSLVLDLFSSINLSFDINMKWISFYAVYSTLCMLCLVSFLCNPDLSKCFSLKKSFGKFINYFLVITILSAFLIFIGVPKLLHVSTRNEGERVVTVIKKTSGGARVGCSPRLRIKEFNFYSRSICAGVGVWNALQVGDQITVTGQLSDYGVNINQISWTIDDETIILKKNVSIIPCGWRKNHCYTVIAQLTDSTY